jgi:hypothetical protein
MSPRPKLMVDITNRIRGCLPSNPKGRHALRGLPATGAGSPVVGIDAARSPWRLRHVP